MNTKLAAQTIEFIAASSALNDRLMGEVQAQRTREKQAAAKRQAVLDLMLSTGCVAPHQKQAAADMLGSHAQSLDLLVNAINKMQSYKTASEKAASDLGHAVSDKEAGVKSVSQVRDSLNDPYVGRRTSEKKASDLAILAVLNAPRS
jgi:predicted transcriptional regulator